MKATTSKCFGLYGRLVIKKRILLLHIRFLTKCKRKGLIPNFIHVKSSSTSEASKKAIQRAKELWLIEEIKFKHKELATVEEQLYPLHTSLLIQNDYHSAAECVVRKCVELKKECWQKVMSVIEYKLTHRVRQIKQKHSKKLIALSRAQCQMNEKVTPKSIDNFVHNLSSTQFSKRELDLLNKGLNYAIPYPCAPLEEIINNVESAIEYNSVSSKSAIRHNVKGCLLRAAGKHNKTTKKLEEWGEIKKLKAHNVVYARADKGNAVVIMDKQDYDSRVLDMLKTGPYEECVFKNGKPKDPLNVMMKDANLIRQNVASSIGDDSLERKFLVPNAKVAYLYCLPKIHKSPLAMRPIASNISTPTEKMAAWLVDEMKSYPITHGKSVSNSIEFVEQIKNVEVRRGEVLVSFDVTALFPSIPVADAIRSLRHHLDRNRVPPHKTEAYISIANLCMNQNFLHFRGKFYKQTFGLSMGSKISPLLAEVFMSDFESELEKEKFFPRVWKRYVDDVFAVVKERYIPQTLNLLNSQHDTVKFTLEREENGKLPFLDLLITRKADNSVKFSIYRKPTSTDRYITSDSNHFGAQKKAAFHSMVHRMINIPMEEEDYKAEKACIYKAAKLNGYNTCFVDKIIQQHVRKKHRNNCTTLQPNKENVKRVSLPFYPKVTNVITAKLRHHDIQVVHKSRNTLRELLCNLKDKIPSDERSGIYKINCNQCSAAYYGQTRRHFKTRLREHKSAVSNKKVNESSVAAHAVCFQHDIDWGSAKLIKNITKTRNLNTWESMYITTAEEPLMNEDDPPITSALFHLTKLKL